MLALASAPASITASIIVHPSALLTSLRLMFDVLWASALPVRGTGDFQHQSGTLGGADLTDVDRRVVQLLVTGMTDQAIGRQLDLAERTVQRKVRTIMQSLGVTNRLQLGIRLAQQGWGS
ncbi:response regulator transcription factor [Ornithinimicrobium faecis]|uniref:LuxR C-terminal-related transcriptional regulator n=1 Tax=Ornithinimicrobium faecis TaxID=2934158 RepID=A0ABY4YU46_9MICO|nr:MULTISPECIES: helix-turn-helix transcriptional regulator [unclassified Ornithinimicrobium]USQ80136.1 LuxR C-terminal-related transcriptional regulator [Ornithinimicrobium sp. HY1793]